MMNNRLGTFLVLVLIASISLSTLFYLQNNDLQKVILNIKADESTLITEKSALEMEVENLQFEITSIENEKLTLQSRVSDLQSKVSSLENEKNTVRAEVENIQSEKTNLETQVSTLQSNLDSLENDQNSLELQVSNLQLNVENLENNENSLELQVSSLQTDITTLENEVIQSYNTGYLEGELDGYADGYIQGVEDGAGSGYTLRDPTYSEAIFFINLDTTDQNEYTDNYVCHDFSADFKNNAFQAGYRCGYVYIEFPDSAHAIICFNTVDNGMFYVEPQNDQIVTLTIGQPLYDRDLYIVDFDDTIIDFDVIW